MFFHYSDGDWDFYWCDREWLHQNYDTMFLHEHQKILHFRNHYEVSYLPLMEIFMFMHETKDVYQLLKFMCDSYLE